MAHELRTPLAGLKTHAQLALTVEDDRARDACLSQIVVSVDRTARLVRQLLDMSATEACGPSDPADIADVGRITAAIASDLGSIHSRGITLEVAPDLDTLQLPMKADLFALAMKNLMENAVLHSPEGGTVRCHLMYEDGELAIGVDDDGDGIPPEDLPHVTERFYRGTNKTTVGSGLGLSIVEAALGLGGARLVLCNRQGGGLRVQIRSTIKAVPKRAL